MKMHLVNQMQSDMSIQEKQIREDQTMQKHLEKKKTHDPEHAQIYLCNICGK